MTDILLIIIAAVILLISGPGQGFLFVIALLIVCAALLYVGFWITVILIAIIVENFNFEKLLLILFGLLPIVVIAALVLWVCDHIKKRIHKSQVLKIKK
ncbi:MAG: hypothetical protein HY225_03755 [Candidatus Vogelbacteria bacterium]|nr:hypothetical protein [Candidatus Vogelbacteria bacterium]